MVHFKVRALRPWAMFAAFLVGMLVAARAQATLVSIQPTSTGTPAVNDTLLPISSSPVSGCIYRN